MRLEREQVQKMAALAQLELAPEELARLAGELEGILVLMSQLREVDTAAALSTDAATAPVDAALGCPLRDDQQRPSLSREELLAAAPLRDEAFFLVPKVL